MSNQPFHIGDKEWPLIPDFRLSAKDTFMIQDFIVHCQKSGHINAGGLAIKLNEFVMRVKMYQKDIPERIQRFRERNPDPEPQEFEERNMEQKIVGVANELRKTRDTLEPFLKHTALLLDQLENVKSIEQENKDMEKEIEKLQREKAELVVQRVN